MALWSLDAVSLPGRRMPRLDRVTVEIARGVTAVLGQSGAGKTSLLNVLVGFERPQSGRVEFRAAAGVLLFGFTHLTFHLFTPPDFSVGPNTPQCAWPCGAGTDRRAHV